MINTDDALVVGDARLNPMTSTNPSIDKMGVLAWAGYPLRSIHGQVLGTFCVVDTAPRDWTTTEVEILESLAGAAEGEIRLRTLLDHSAAATDRARRDVRRMERLASLAERLALAETTVEVSNAIADLGPDVLGASIAMLGIIDAEQNSIAVRRPPNDDELGTEHASISLDDDLPITDALRTTRTVYLSSPADMLDRYPHVVSEAQVLGLAATASIPLARADGTAIGAMSVGWPSAMQFDINDRSLLRTVALMCAQALERSLLGDVRRALLEQLQCELLPATPAIDGLEIAVRYLPATSGLGFGGDWYDIVDLDDGRTTVIVGDIPGHGIEAAARMSQVRGAVNALARIHVDDLSNVLSGAERLLRHLDEIYIATLLILTIDPAAGLITYVSAGHPAPLLVRPDGTAVTLADGRRPLLGAGTGHCPSGVVPILRGSVLIAFTDGLVERRDQSSDLGAERVIATIAGSPSLQPESLADRIIDELIGDRVVTDDVALVAIRIQDPSPHADP